MQLCQLACRHFIKNSRKSVLPFITVTEKSKFERRTIQENKLNVDNGFFILYVVSYFGIPRKGKYIAEATRAPRQTLCTVVTAESKEARCLLERGVQYRTLTFMGGGVLVGVRLFNTGHSQTNKLLEGQYLSVEKQCWPLLKQYSSLAMRY